MKMRLGRVVFRDAVDVPLDHPTSTVNESLLEDPRKATRQPGDFELHWEDGVVRVKNRKSKRVVMVPAGNVKSFTEYAESVAVPVAVKP